MAELKDILAHLASDAPEDRALVERAYHFVQKAHEGHTRYSGEPYLSHLAAVADSLAEMGMGPKTVAAGLLHDVIEDTGTTPESVGGAFGEEILFLVEGVTKLGSVRYHGTDRHNESLRKLFVATSQDIRVLLIKLTDRLHNMQTLEHVPEEKRERIARETLEVYVPVAHRLGMGRLRKELEDLAFPYVYPVEHQKVMELARPRLAHADEILEKARKAVQKKLVDAKVQDFKTSGRVKGMYSLFRKLQRRSWDIDAIYDLLALRVIVGSMEECYHALGVVHELWRPLPQRVKDFIAFPKPNGYRSLHTTVITRDKVILEVQIRTEEMHREAEFGIASHLVYKEEQTGDRSAASHYRTWVSSLIPALFRQFPWSTPEQPRTSVSSSGAENRERVPTWIEEIADAHRDATDTDEFVSNLRQDFFSHRIFTFTPKGDVVDLPIGASPIDFAYAIHTDIGNHIAGAKVNGKLVGLDTELKNGDIVEIDRRDASHPTRKWLPLAKTSLAQRHIRAEIDEDMPRAQGSKNNSTKRNS